MNSQAIKQPLPIFVYGTLMLGQPNDYIWQDAIARIESAFLPEGCLYDNGYYPVLTKEPYGRVKGQLIHLKQDQYEHILARLDALEGFDPASPQDSVFTRASISVITRHGESVDAWTYTGNKEQLRGLPIIEQGDWIAYHTGRSAV